MAVEIAPGITVDGAVSFGKPVVKGTRVPVHIVIGSLASGLPAEKVVKEYDLTLEDIRACLAYAARLVSAAILVVEPGRVRICTLAR